MNARKEGRRHWALGLAGLMLLVLGLFASQAFAAAMTVTAQPLQNAGTDGKLTKSADWSGATAALTRHESTDLTINGSDQVTDVTVQGTKPSHSGTLNVTVTLKDSAAGTLTSGTGALSTTAGAYSQLVTMGAATLYRTVASLSAVYSFTPAAWGFVWFTNATDISLTTTGSWQTISLASYVPTDATGAIVELVNTGTTDALSGVVGGTEDTNDYMSNSLFSEMEGALHRWQIVKLDANRQIQGYIENTAIDFKLLGYTKGSDPVYFTTPANVAPGTTGSYQTVSVSSQVDSDATGVILLVANQGGSDYVFGIRETGSSFSSTSLEVEQYHNTMYLVGLNGSKQFDAYIASTNVKLFLVGQTKGSVVYYTNDVAVTDPTTGSWQTVDADTYSVPGEANGLFLYIANTESTNNTDRILRLRHGDSTDQWNGEVSGDNHIQGAVGINAANQWDEYMSATTVNVSIAAYTKVSP